jgi:acetoin utilization protein AcuC
VLGGGGYNPWSVGRLWTGVWATLNGHEIPDRLPQEGEDVLRALRWDRARAGRSPPEHWFTTLRDVAAPRPGAPEDHDRIDACRSARRRGVTFPIF